MQPADDPSEAPLVQPGEVELASTSLRRWLLRSVGSLSVALGIAGAVLPLLPTTPFLLLAAACFARSSPELHASMLANPSFGPYLRQWRRDRSIPATAKRRAYVLVVVTFALSISFADANAIRWTLAAVGIALLIFLVRLPTSSGEEPNTVDSPPE